VPTNSSADKRRPRKSEPQEANKSSLSVPSASVAPAPAKQPRVPASAAGIQVNFCKNPACKNFSVPVPETTTKGRPTNGVENPYTLTGTAAKSAIARCNGCGEHFPIKSNIGVFEEAWRISSETFPAPCCPDVLCGNHCVPSSTDGAYYRFGATKAGSARLRCRSCGRTFSVKPPGLNPIARQIRSDKNPTILAMLANKTPLRRICEMADIAPRVLYERIDFFHRQAIAFLSDREQRLPEMDIKRLYIGVDRQDYVVNWTERKDRRNVVVSAVASADNTTGYVFAMNPNFDPELDPTVIEDEATLLGDALLPPSRRRFARLWLKADFMEAVANPIQRKVSSTLQGEITGQYDAAVQRTDIESPESFTKGDRLPRNGMLVHSEYTLWGHFLHLHRLLPKAEKIRFFLDQDSGMRAACLGAFADRILDRSVDAFYVRISKELTIDQKRVLVGISRREFEERAAAHPELKPNQVKLMMLRERCEVAAAIGRWKDRWVFHPLPNMAEPEKASCLLTDFGDYDLDHLAWLHNKASLHGVDSYFNRIRRRSSMLERPIASAANRRRVWNGYSPYRPEQIGKLLTIYRACHNYIWLADGVKDTPAMRLGLAKASLHYKDIIYFA